jgi:hypothetical protein
MAQNGMEMHDAILARNVNSLKRLIQGGANVNLVYSNSRPLDTAIKYRSSKEMIVLIDYGARTVEFAEKSVPYFLQLLDNYIYLLGKFVRIHNHSKPN